MSESFLERFSIPEVSRLIDYNLIGLHFGNSTVSAAQATWNTVEKRIEVRRLHLNAGATLMENPNAYYINKSLTRLITGPGKPQSDTLQEAERYYNFVRCPGTDAAREPYVFDNGERGPYTRQELMGIGFNCVVNALFEHNYATLFRDKPTIILTDRPAGPEWEAHEQEYASLLKNSLRLPPEQKPAYVAIQSESSAALAFEINRSTDRARIRNEEVCIVLNNGGSTFDITVITPDGIPSQGEDSFQFGGNLLDENLLAYAQAEFRKENPNSESDEREQKLTLRMLKEKYYGLGGLHEVTQVYLMLMRDKDGKPILRNNGKPKIYEFHVDADTMERCLNDMPVQLWHIDSVLAGGEKKSVYRANSWLDGCRLVYQRFYDKMKAHFKKRNENGDPRIPVIPDKIILTGGVSVMPEVQKVVEEAFGVKPSVSSHPNYAVSEGLAFILCEEMNERLSGNSGRRGSVIPRQTNDSEERGRIAKRAKDKGRRKMRKSILERFSIPELGKISDYNLIGIDFGDGEISAAQATWNTVEKRIEVKRLHLNAGATLMKNPNAYYISKSLTRLITDPGKAQSDTLQEAERYYNFKRCPGTDAAKESYVFDNGERGPYTRQELMGIGFNCVVNALFEHNYATLSRDKPTIIFVGRPSSAGWEAHEQEYADLLKDSLRLPPEQKPAYLAIQSESSAALAFEINRSTDRARIQNEEVYIVLDNGSSTFDITVITPDGIPSKGEDSFQFGGNLLDENLLAYAQAEFRKENPNSESDEREQKLTLRMLKEKYYGLDGLHEDTQVYMMHMRDKNGNPILRSNGKSKIYEFHVNADTMERCLNDMPVQLWHIDSVLAGGEKKSVYRANSWLDGCRLVYQRFYDKMKAHFKKRNENGDPRIPVIPDKIILTGGVSVMPEVQKVVEEVFGVKPSVSCHPNYAVSEGLAYVVGTEFRKREYLQELMADMRKNLPGSESLKEDIFYTSVEDVYKVYTDSLEKWANAPGSLSIRTWEKQYFDEQWYDLPDKSARNLNTPVIQGSEYWFRNRGVESKVSNLLKEKFQAIFPDYSDRFSYQWVNPPLDSLHGVRVTTTLDYEYFFDLKPNNISIDELLSPYDRQRLYQAFKNKADGVKHGNTYTRREVIGHGFFGGAKYGDREYEYPGLYSYYERDFPFSRIAGIREEILTLMDKPLKEYVESITPYFHMTAKQE